jgi:hypothetical protein
MQIIHPAALLTIWALTVAATGQAPRTVAPAPSKPAATVRQAPHEVATHATKGVVKAVTATAIVITRNAGGKRTETSFVVTPSTQRAGAVAAGATVEIRYRTDGKQRIATAISVEAAPE